MCGYSQRDDVIQYNPHLVIIRSISFPQPPIYNITTRLFICKELFTLLMFPMDHSSPDVEFTTTPPSPFDLNPFDIGGVNEPPSPIALDTFDDLTKNTLPSPFALDTLAVSSQSPSPSPFVLDSFADGTGDVDALHLPDLPSPIHLEEYQGMFSPSSRSVNLEYYL